jgi:hypothetical protein
MYLRFTLSFRDVEELLAERGIAVTYEPIFPTGTNRLALSGEFVMRVLLSCFSLNPSSRMSPVRIQ